MRDLVAIAGDLAPAEEVQSPRVSARVYGIMALTTVVTFATLTTGYQLFFQHHLYA
jgi:hypothetical protein